jgi:histone deacetylase 1/2
MSDFGEEYTHVPLQCDNISAISLAKNPVLHYKTKHIEVRYHFLRDSVEKGKIALIHVPTQDQLADIFTKPLDQATFTRLTGGEGGAWCLFDSLNWVCGSSFVAYV